VLETVQFSTDVVLPARNQRNATTTILWPNLFVFHSPFLMEHENMLVHCEVML